MFDPDIIDSLNTHDKHMLKMGIDLILQTGIVSKQREAMFARLYAGSASEDPEKLAEKILKSRVTTQALESIEQLGEQLKGNTDEEDSIDENDGHRI
jgi:hypothetical protein